MSINFNRLLDNPIPLHRETILHYYQKHNFYRKGLLVNHNKPLPQNTAYILFKDQGVLIFGEDVQKETLKDDEFVSWWNSQSQTDLERTLLAMIVLESSERDNFPKEFYIDTYVDFTLFDILKPYFALKIRDLNFLHDKYMKIRSK